MSHSGRPGTLSSGSPGGPSCGSRPSNLVYRPSPCAPSPCPAPCAPSPCPAPCAPSPCPRGPSPHGGRQEPCREPPSCPTPPSRGPRTSLLCGPCGTTRPGPLGCGSPSLRPLGLGACGLPPQSYGSGFCHPSCSPSRVTQASCYRPAWGCHRR